ncbi:glycosyl hydrolases family 31-domain-containing protein [Aspergillus pseudoustus]|uniref:alpha-glucosidase n=1 Tax=Aspergillus pseudoustus TaxID=1810923 RepID=A0ABR4JCR2_9EURO
MLGAFSHFYHNHNKANMITQEFYRWESVAKAARKAIALRYQLLDYVYTLIYRQTRTGQPWLLPLFFAYPANPQTYGIDLQFFYGNALLISPVAQKDSASVNAYLPDDLFYDWYSGHPVRGQGEVTTLTEISYSDIPVHVKGGSILPVRVDSANTTAELRRQPFRLVIAPGLDGRAPGELYLDDGESLEQPATLQVSFTYEDNQLSFDGVSTLETGIHLESVTVLGGEACQRLIAVDLPLTGPRSLDLA